jgi:hypothetical protein
MQTQEELVAEDPRARASRARVPYATPIAIPVSEACRIGGFGNTMAYSLIKQGKLKVVKIGNRTLVNYASLERLLTPPDDAA